VCGPTASVLRVTQRITERRIVHRVILANPALGHHQLHPAALPHVSVLPWSPRTAMAVLDILLLCRPAVDCARALWTDPGTEPQILAARSGRHLFRVARPRRSWSALPLAARTCPRLQHDAFPGQIRSPSGVHRSSPWSDRGGASAPRSLTEENPRVD